MAKIPKSSLAGFGRDAEPTDLDIARLLKQSGLPDGKSLGNLDETLPPS